MDTKTQVKTDTSYDLETIMAELANLRSEMALLAKHAVKAPVAALSDAGDRITAGANQLIDTAKSAGKSGANSIEAQIDAHPIASLFAAFTLGLVASRLIGGGGKSDQ